MSFTTEDSKLILLGDGAETVFPYNFLIYADTHLAVYLDGVLQSIGYTVDGVGDALGGNVTFVAAPAADVVVTLNLEVPFTQELSYTQGGKFPSASHEKGLDLNTMLCRRLNEVDSRALLVPQGGDSTEDLELPSQTERASKFLAFDADGNPIAAAGTSADLGPVSSFINTLLDDASASDAQSTLLLGNLLAPVNDFRLTLTSGSPVTTADVSGASARTIYCAPYTGNRIALYDGSNWRLRTSAEFSLALGTLTASRPYDVFCYDNAGVPTLEFLVWTNATTRATGLTRQDGVWVKSGAVTRRYMGTFYTNNTTDTEDSAAKRYLWNFYHRRARPMSVVESTANWTYTTATWRQARATATNQLDYVVGLSEDAVTARVLAIVYNSGTTATTAVGVGVDSTTANSAKVCGGGAAQNQPTASFASYAGYPGIGRHTLVWLEISENLGTTTWLGDDAGGGVPVRSGITGEVAG